MQQPNEPIRFYVLAVSLSDVDGRSVSGIVTLDLDALESLLAVRRAWHEEVRRVVDDSTGVPE